MTTEYSEEMSRSYLDYAMSVIVSRAIPDVRDGLKPVQRRTLYAMHELNLKHDGPFRKSARIVGDTMGKYHPHGDSSIYDALVVMAQKWKKEEVLVDGHGNFGSIEGDEPAASRYTEARLSEISECTFLADLDKNVVDFTSNFDGTEQEPVILPAQIPNILVNGANGIAVGMRTSIPTHNLKEVLEAEKLLLRNPDATTEELMEKLSGPDFPTGGIIVGSSETTEELFSIYNNGTGKIRLRGKTEIHPRQVVVTEIPYGMDIPKFLSDVQKLVNEKKLPGISNVADQSSGDQIRIVIELKNGVNAEQVQNILFEKTGLEESLSVNMLAVVGGIPKVVSLKEILQGHIQFLKEINTRKYQYLLKQEKKRKEVLEGDLKALQNIDSIIVTIRESKDRASAKAALISQSFTNKQAEAILDMRVANLTKFDAEEIKKECVQREKNIQKYTKILSSPLVMQKTINNLLDSLAQKFGRERRTTIS